MLRRRKDIPIKFIEDSVNQESKEPKEAYVKRHVKRFKDNGYNPIHLFGTWYLVRHKSKNYTKISYYRPFNVAKHY